MLSVGGMLCLPVGEEDCVYLHVWTLAVADERKGLYWRGGPTHEEGDVCSVDFDGFFVGGGGVGYEGEVGDGGGQGGGRGRDGFRGAGVGVGIGGEGVERGGRGGGGG